MGTTGTGYWAAGTAGHWTPATEDTSDRWAIADTGRHQALVETGRQVAGSSGLSTPEAPTGTRHQQPPVATSTSKHQPLEATKGFYSQWVLIPLRGLRTPTRHNWKVLLVVGRSSEDFLKTSVSVEIRILGGPGTYHPQILSAHLC